MPVDDEAGKPARLSTWPWRLFGYGWEFDAQGRAGARRISFETLARLLTALAEEGARNGLRIELIIIAPEYVPLLLETESGRNLESLRGKLTRKPVWIRHDEHVHVDFALVHSHP
jgi:penicillin-insensitive murein endopeptidase